jgi:oxygen-independent coproporphyrinogen-3 oxidase
MLAALLKEIALRQDYFKEEPVETIYLGGGTPSLLSVGEIRALLETIHRSFRVAPDAEITMEANPDDLGKAKLDDLVKSGVNRLSIGIQSFFDADLQWMNRAHNAQQALASLQLTREYSDNLTIDLIYGIPGLTNERWQENVQTSVELNIPHLSCYALTVEPRTPLDKLIREQRLDDVSPEIQSEQFLLLMRWMAAAGYEHYEISNFARPGFRSRHNSSYWQRKQYLGFGPSAHSFDGNRRWWNVSNNHRYIESITRGAFPVEIEELTDTQKTNELIMVSLRTMEGLDFSSLDPALRKELLKESQKYIAGGKLTIEDNFLRLTDSGKLLADGIAADLFRT